MHDFALEWIADPSTGRPRLMRWLVDGEVYYTQVRDGTGYTVYTCSTTRYRHTGALRWLVSGEVYYSTTPRCRVVVLMR